MQAEETKMILRYFGGIEAQLDDVNIELAELRDRYNPIKGIVEQADADSNDVETQEEASEAEEKPGRKGRKTAAE